MKEKQWRSVLKSISWRLIGTLDTVILSWIISGRITIAFSRGIFELFTKMLLYYLHERLWGKINIGTDSGIQQSAKTHSTFLLNVENPQKSNFAKITLLPYKIYRFQGRLIRNKVNLGDRYISARGAICRRRHSEMRFKKLVKTAHTLKAIFYCDSKNLIICVN